MYMAVQKKHGSTQDGTQRSTQKSGTPGWAIRGFGQTKKHSIGKKKDICLSLESQGGVA